MTKQVEFGFTKRIKLKVHRQSSESFRVWPLCNNPQVDPDTVRITRFWKDVTCEKCLQFKHYFPETAKKMG